MSFKGMISSGVVVCLVLGLGAPSRAEDPNGDEGWVFISNLTGNDTTGEGTRAKPFETVQRALLVGPKVRFLPNAPNTPYPRLYLEGDAFTEYVFAADAGPAVTRWYGFVSPGNRSFRLTGFLISNSTLSGIYLGSGDTASIYNCIIAYCGSHGIVGPGGANIINCVIYGNNGHGVTPAAPVVINCIMSHNNGFGMATGCCWTARYSIATDNVEGEYSQVNVYNPLPSRLAFVNPEECDFRLKDPDAVTPGLFHEGDPGIKNPDGSRSDPGAFGGPDAARWFARYPGARPVIGSIQTDKSDDGSGKVKVKVRVRLGE